MDERDLNLRFKASDPKALRVLFDRYYAPLVEYVYYLPGMQVWADDDRRSEANDRAQDAFIAMWIQREKFDTNKQFNTLLYRIARNKCIDELVLNKKYCAELNLNHKSKKDDDEPHSEDSNSLILTGKGFRWADLPNKKKKLPLLAPEDERWFPASPEENIDYSNLVKELAIVDLNKTYHEVLLTPFQKRLKLLNRRERVMLAMLEYHAHRRVIEAKFRMTPAAYDAAMYRMRKKFKGFDVDGDRWSRLFKLMFSPNRKEKCLIGNNKYRGKKTAAPIPGYKRQTSSNVLAT
jgi:DNA-directed RNA polymerase specialized sigma24 family protein